MQAGKAGRGDGQRQRCRFAEDRRRQIAAVDVDHDALAQADRFERRAIVAQGRFGVCAAVDVLEERAWHPAACQLAQVEDVRYDSMHVRFRLRISGTLRGGEPASFAAHVHEGCGPVSIEAHRRRARPSPVSGLV
jgi:hypothetical protein